MVTRTEKLLLYSRQHYYERANKAHILAFQLRKDAEKRTPYSLRNSKGYVVHDPTTVSSLFHSFFTKLYSLPDSLPSHPGERENMLGRFLSTCQLPRLTSEVVASLNAPIPSLVM